LLLHAYFSPTVDSMVRLSLSYLEDILFDNDDMAGIMKDPSSFILCKQQGV